jgi:hypothetical protein
MDLLSRASRTDSKPVQTPTNTQIHGNPLILLINILICFYYKKNIEFLFIQFLQCNSLPSELEVLAI